MSRPAAEAFEWLFRSPPPDSGIAGEALAGLLVELARTVEPKSSGQPTGVSAVDLRLEQLRTLLVGHEIEVLGRLREVVEDPERLGLAVGRVLPTAVAANDPRLGPGLAPVLGKAKENSIPKHPPHPLHILHPLIVPAVPQPDARTI